MQPRKLLHAAMVAAGGLLIVAGVLRGEILAPLGWPLTIYPLMIRLSECLDEVLQQRQHGRRTTQEYEDLA